MSLQQFVNPFCEEAEIAFFQPHPSILEIAVNVRLKEQTTASFRLLCCVFAQLRELNLRLDTESKKHVSSRSCVCIFQSEWEQMLYWEISASKTKTNLPNRKVFNVSIRLTELNWCVCAAVCKPFLWKSRNHIFPATSKHWRNSYKCPSETQNDHVFQTALLCVRSTQGAESAVRYREWEARFF